MKHLFISLLIFSSVFAGEEIARYKGTYQTDSMPMRQTREPMVELAARQCPIDNSFIVVLDFLYWKGENNAFPFALNNTNLTNVPPPTGDFVRVDFDWEPAFRVGLGWDTLFDYWDVFASWTYFHNHSRKSVTVNANNFGGIFPLWGSAVNVGTWGSTRGEYMLNYNMVDLELGRVFYFSRNISFRIHMGGKGGWLRQRFFSRYDNPVNNPLAFAESIFLGEDDYWGVGPRTGFNGNWEIGKGFCLFGDLALALLYGKVDTRQRNRVLNSNPGTGIYFPIFDFRDDYWELGPNLQMIFGAAWRTCFYNDKMFFSLKAGWETNYWWNQFHLAHIEVGLPSVPESNHPLILKGLTLEARFDF